jgi:hypothetical protein
VEKSKLRKQMENEPKYGSQNYQCPHCGVIAQQSWFEAKSGSDTIYKTIWHLFYNKRTNMSDYAQEYVEKFLKSVERSYKENLLNIIPGRFSVSTCTACKDIALWAGDEIVYPKRISLPPPNEDLSADIKSIYMEATSIFLDSPKGATALLRLALQMLLKQIGKEGKNINNDIKVLVSEGLNVKIQQALDLLRVVGNNAVHPGQIDLDDNSEIAFKLFNILNFIADEMISKPKEIESLYGDVIPDHIKEHIKKRDS